MGKKASVGKMLPTEKTGVKMRRSADGQTITYYVRITADGQRRDIKVGTSDMKMTVAKAARMRKQYIAGKLPIPQDERRKLRAARARKKRAEAARMTYARIWELWLQAHGEYNRLTNDSTHWNWRLKDTFKDMTPADITPSVLMAFKNDLLNMLTVPIGPLMKLQAAEKLGSRKLIDQAQKNFESKREPLAYATQYQVLGLLRRLTLWAFESELVKPVFIKWKIKQPNEKAPDNLTREQIQNLIDVCMNFGHAAGSMVLLALYTGARRNEILNLKWSDIDFDFGTIKLGVNMMSGTTKDGSALNRIPANSYAMEVLKRIPKISDTWVFPSPQTGRPYVNPTKQLMKLKEAANLPPSFRIFHGCRHIFASYAATLSNSLTVKDLLTHKSVVTSEKYAHVPEEHLRAASEKAAALYHQPAGGADVIDLEQKRTA